MENKIKNQIKKAKKFKEKIKKEGYIDEEGYIDRQNYIKHYFPSLITNMFKSGKYSIRIEEEFHTIGSSHPLVGGWDFDDENDFKNFIKLCKSENLEKEVLFF